MPKLNIYVPEALAADIRRYGISQSRVCQRALEEEVSKMGLMESVVSDERLAAARARLAGERQNSFTWYELGHQQGWQWALDEAPGTELRRLERAVSSSDWGRFQFEIRTNEYHSASAWMLDFSRTWVKGGIPAEYWAEFDRGFAEGAAAALHRIEAED